MCRQRLDGVKLEGWTGLDCGVFFTICRRGMCHKGNLCRQQWLMCITHLLYSPNWLLSRAFANSSEPVDPATQTKRALRAFWECTPELLYLQPKNIASVLVLFFFFPYNLTLPPKPFKLFRFMCETNFEPFDNGCRYDGGSLVLLGAILVSVYRKLGI